MYTFQDRGGDSLTLRPEGTAPVVRAYLQHGMHTRPQPVKVCYVASIFRYDRPQAGRLRQHHQLGLEALGDPDASVDAEVIGLLWHLFSSLGLSGLSLQLNSIGDPACRPAFVQALVDYYAPHKDRLCENCKVRLQRNPLRLLDCKEESCQPLVAQAPRTIDYLCPECAEHFQLLRSYLQAMGIAYTLNHTLVRGLDYYTRTVFEVWPEETGRQSALGGGGRYDGLAAQLGDRSVPGVGFGTGIERIILNLKKRGIAPPQQQQVTIFVALLGEKAKEVGVGLVHSLRTRGLRVLMSHSPRSLKAQMRQASALSADYVVMLGEDELARNVVILRDMASATQEPVPQDQLASTLERLSARGRPAPSQP